VKEIVFNYVSNSLHFKVSDMELCEDKSCKHENCVRCADAGGVVSHYKDPLEGLTDEEISLILQSQTNRTLTKIFRCAVFFVGFTVLSIAGAVVYYLVQAAG